MERTASPDATGERRSPTPAAVLKREAIRQLKGALEEERMLLNYQPIVSAGNSRLAGVEALLRWRKPETEKEALTRLIWAAERSPVIFKLENWTLREAFHAAAAWPAAGLSGLRVNVNLSAREFPRADLVGRVTRRLASAGLPPSGVGLEITETSSIHEFAAVAEQLERLIAMGIELWLDDFGTGHSSLEWLSHLPLHGVKIAGTFVERLLAETRCQSIVTRVIEMAHDLGLRVAAEGIETPAQREWLADRGCDLLQGFLLYAPMPAEDLPGALAGVPILAASPQRP
jgi:EAL domain-containing protein (putative c-di-GMP-specific phosphodiesterase class I)